ncbi:MAG: anaerobic ribonucleoside-triphosphate reductase, partial [Candidatus Moraniibacteriota bacterium]
LWDVEATKNLVRKIAENYTLPYFTLTPTFSICPSHGYIAGEYHTCPQCIAPPGKEMATVAGESGSKEQKAESRKKRKK